MKKILVIAASLVLGAAVSFAGQASNVEISGKANKSMNKAQGAQTTAVQNVQSVNVGKKGKVKNVTISGEADKSINKAQGYGAKAVQNVQSVNVQ